MVKDTFDENFIKNKDKERDVNLFKIKKREEELL